MFKKISLRTAGLCGVIGPLIAIGTIIISIQIQPWFNWTDYALSNLGHIGISYNWVFNIGLIISSVFGLVFSIGLIKFMERSLGKAGGVIFGLANITMILIAVFPMGTLIHRRLSVFPPFALTLLVVGIDQLREESDRLWGVFSLSILLLGVISVLLIVSVPNLGWAIPETIAVIAFAEFSIVFGARLLKIL